MRTEFGKRAVNCEADVAIIGYGPAGATLANLLGQSGISTLVLEREEAAYHLPRAVHFDDEVMRVFDTIGLAEAIEQMVHVSPGMRFIDAAGRCLLEWPRPKERTPQGWHASYRFHQPELECILRQGLQRFPSVSVRTRIEALAVDDDAYAMHGRIRADGRMAQALHLVEVKTPVESKGPWDLVKQVGTIPVDQAFRPLSESHCPAAQMR